MKQRIFVMIPSYRDPVLKDTLDTMYDLADHPDRVFAAVGAQYDEEIPMPDLSKYSAKNLRVLSIHPEGRPSIFRLRHILNKLYFGEEYYVSIDSHTIFTKSWDSMMIDMLESKHYYKTIISAYEDDSPNPAFDTHYNQTRLHLDFSEEFGYRLNMPGPVEVPWRGDQYVPSYYLQAGMFFTRGEFATENRWGKFWQHEQEEAFITFESFMLGWNNELYLGEVHPFTHQPDRYYEAVYNTAPNSPIRDFKDSYQYQVDDRPSVCRNIMRALLYNEGPYRIQSPQKTPEQFWHWQGMADDYYRLTRDNAYLF